MVAVASSHQVPLELLRAAGLSAYVYRATHDTCPSAQPYLEEHGLARRARSLIESAITGELSDASLVVFPRASEQDYKASLYLRELARQQRLPAMPPVMLFDVLYTQTPESYAYSLARTRQFYADAAAIAGGETDAARVHQEIRQSNTIRALARRVVARREGTPRITGTQALSMLASLAERDPDAGSSLTDALQQLDEAAEITGPRLLLLGTQVDDLRLHTFLESRGAVVVAEDGGWGTRSVGRDISTDGDPFAAILAKYLDDVPAVRASSARWLQSFTRDTIDGVVTYLPPDDSVAGWDHPGQREYFAERGIPTFVIRDDIADATAALRYSDTFGEFVHRIAGGH